MRVYGISPVVQVDALGVGFSCLEYVCSSLTLVSSLSTTSELRTPDHQNHPGQAVAAERTSGVLLESYAISGQLSFLN
jgi:hypothetical protein